MYSEKTKTLFFVAWAVAVCFAAITVGMSSVPSGIVVACVAIVPIVVARYFWRAPEQTTSERIHAARQ